MGHGRFYVSRRFGAASFASVERAIHGTPNPAKVGKTESNGCIRMTNGSVAALADVVKPGVPVTMRE